MLVEGALKFAKIGRQAIVDGDVPKAHANIVKTEDIYYELMATLDLNTSGEWGAALYKVYDFIVYKLVEANTKKDVTIMDEVIPFIEDVKNTWDEAYRTSKSQK
jgi:flagellar protein FliS